MSLKFPTYGGVTVERAWEIELCDLAVVTREVQELRAQCWNEDHGPAA